MNAIKNYYKNHPKTFYAAIGLLVITIAIIAIFGANSSLFQGNLGSVAQLPVLPGKVESLNQGLSGSRTTTEESQADEDTAANVDIADSDIIAESNTAEPQTTGGSRFSIPSSSDSILRPNENIGANVTINGSELGQIDEDFTTFNTNTNNNSEDDTENDTQQTATNTTNTPPVADSVRITVNGSLQAGSSLTGNYDYFDAEVDSENGSTFRWLIANSADGSFTPTGSVTRNYEITSSDAGKFLIFEVTPKNTISAGTAVQSSAVGPILAQVSQPPTATNVRIIGDPVVGASLLGTYQYSDPENDPETGSVLKWLKVTNGQNTVIAMDTDVYQIKAEDLGSQIVFSYQPRNAVATTTGAETMSAPIGPITAAASAENGANTPNETEEDIIGQNTDNNADNTASDEEEEIINQNEDILMNNNSLPTTQTPTATSNQTQTNSGNNTGNNASGSAAFNLNSNTNANLLSAANVPGNTGPEALLIFPTLGLLGLGLGRKLAKKK